MERERELPKSGIVSTTSPAVEKSTISSAVDQAGFKQMVGAAIEGIAKKILDSYQIQPGLPCDNAKMVQKTKKDPPEPAESCLPTLILK